MTNQNEDRRLDRRAFAQMSALGLAASAELVASLARPGRAAAKTQTGPANAFTALRGKPVNIGVLIYPNMFQIDFTGPFDVLSRVPDAKVHVIGVERGPIKDHMGLTLTPEYALDAPPPIDLLHVPGGPGQEAQMRNEVVLALIRDHVAAGKPLFSVCTGGLLCGAAGVFRGRRATTHWSAFDLLPYFGAIPVRERYVLDGDILSTAGATAGIDGALKVASLLRSDEAAQCIQLDLQYAPQPPFNAGVPETAPRSVLATMKRQYQPLVDARLKTAIAAAERLGVAPRA